MDDYIESQKRSKKIKLKIETDVALFLRESVGTKDDLVIDTASENMGKYVSLLQRILHHSHHGITATHIIWKYCIP